MMYSLEIHHPFIVNASSVEGKRIMRLHQTDHLFFYTSLISSIPRLMASSFIGIKWWWRSGSVFFNPLITLSRVTIGAIFNNPPSTIMLNALALFISLAASMASMR